MYSFCCAGVQFRLTSPLAEPDSDFLQLASAVTSSAAPAIVPRNELFTVVLTIGLLRIYYPKANCGPEQQRALDACSPVAASASRPCRTTFGRMTILVLAALVAGGSFCAGLLGALTGLGGGIVVVPMLTLLFHVDLRYAVGASLVSVIATSSGAAAAYVREGYTNVRVGILL